MTTVQALVRFGLIAVSFFLLQNILGTARQMGSPVTDVLLLGTALLVLGFVSRKTFDLYRNRKLMSREQMEQHFAELNPLRVLWNKKDNVGFWVMLGVLALIRGILFLVKTRGR